VSSALTTIPIVSKW